MAYVDRLRELGRPHEVVLFGTGHSSFDIEEEVRQQQAVLDFLDRNVPPA
jgi:dipeptidyl aminopeptidase/acylaminoacyl peptidase